MSNLITAGSKVQAKNSLSSEVLKVISLHKGVALVTSANEHLENKMWKLGYRPESIFVKDLVPAPSLNESIAIHAYANGDNISFNYKKPGETKATRRIVTINGFYISKSGHRGINTYDHTREEHRSFRFSRMTGNVKIINSN